MLLSTLLPRHDATSLRSLLLCPNYAHHRPLLEHVGLDVALAAHPLPAFDSRGAHDALDEELAHRAAVAGPWTLVETMVMDVEGVVNLEWLLSQPKDVIARHGHNRRAVWRILLGYHDGAVLHMAQGETYGTFVGEPRGETGRFEAHFVPSGEHHTFSELERLERANKVCARRRAAQNLAHHRTSRRPVATDHRG